MKHTTILKIAKRARELGDNRDILSIVMDVETVHKKTPLDLERLLAADNFNFSHDIAGIRRHLDRETGKLLNHFIPRFS